MVSFIVISAFVVISVAGFIVMMNRHGEKLTGDEEDQPMIWADEDWYKEDGPPDG